MLPPYPISSLLWIPATQPPPRHGTASEASERTTPNLPPSSTTSPDGPGKPPSRNDGIEVLELSMARKKAPEFSGSIYAQSLPPLKMLFEGEEDEEMILRAIEIRRGVTMEAFVEAMRRGRFGITYSANLGSRMAEFLDYAMIQAASMKQLPEFSRSSFNVRAKIFLDSSGVVPLIRYRT